MTQEALHQNPGYFANHVTSSNPDAAKLLYLRMGHVPFAQMKYIQEDVNGQVLFDQVICIVYPHARQQRLVFSTLVSKLICVLSYYMLTHGDLSKQQHMMVANDF